MSFKQKIGIIDAPPKDSIIEYGFKTTGECVPFYYKFGVWYQKEVHVIPRKIEVIKRYPTFYEMHTLYPCEYVLDYKVPDSAFEMTKYVRVFNERTSVVVRYDGVVMIGEEEFI